jgi:hypothetical protein
VKLSDTVSRPIDDDTLKRVAEDHLSYELAQMALGTFRLTQDKHLGNTVLEAFLVHVRVLDEFLRKGTPRGEDVLAVDYCPIWTPLGALDCPTRTEIDRRIAHLTVRRTNDFRWTDLKARHTLTRAVNRRFLEFLAQLKVGHPDRAALSRLLLRRVHLSAGPRRRIGVATRCCRRYPSQR